MDEKINSLLISEKDNVAVVLEKMNPGDVACYHIPGTSEVGRTFVCEEIQQYHKVSIKEIKKDERILKYGEIIGSAYCDIAPGKHVHLHNVKDKRNQLVLEGR